MGRPGKEKGKEAGPPSGDEAARAFRDQEALRAVEGLLSAYAAGDADAGERFVHLPTSEIIEWKGLANIWHASVDEFRQTVTAHREEPLRQETVRAEVQWLSSLTAMVRLTVRTSLQDGRSFESPALFLVTPDRTGVFKVALSWWGAFPDWFQG
jgi:hypothetical protein